MADRPSSPSPAESDGAFAALVGAEHGYSTRLLRVLRLDDSVYAEIESDPHAIPQAFATVIATSLIAGLSHFSIAGLFLRGANAILIWAVTTVFVWAVAGATSAEGERTPSFTRLLRCLGFAYVFVALLVGADIPWIGWIFGWAAVGLTVTSAVFAIRQVLGVATGKAIAIGAAAIGLPILVLLGALW